MLYTLTDLHIIMYAELQQLQHRSARSFILELLHSDSRILYTIYKILRTSIIYQS